MLSAAVPLLFGFTLLSGDTRTFLTNSRTDGVWDYDAAISQGLAVCARRLLLQTRGAEREHELEFGVGRPVPSGAV